MNETVLLLHSTGTSPAIWSSLPEALSNGRTVISPANLGYPPNAPVARGTAVSGDDDARHALGLLDATSRVHLVGHSYGGLLAIKIAKVLGPRVASLFLAEPVLFGALANDDAASSEALAEARSFFEHATFVRDDERGGDEAWLEAFIDYWNRPGAWRRLFAEAKESTRAVSWKMYQEVKSCFFDPIRFDDVVFDVPFTLFVGGRSTLSARAIVDCLAQRNPTAFVDFRADVGHMAPITRPDVVNDALARHFERFESAR